MAPLQRTLCGVKPRYRLGFTLIELLVALAVMSVATTVFMKLYVSATDFARTSRDRGIATVIAEERLSHIRNHPGQYIWQLPDPPSSMVFPVLAEAEEPTAGNSVSPPKSLPPELDAVRKTEVLYDQFRWKVFGRTPDPSASYVEVTVAVYWKQGGRDQQLALSSAVTRRALSAAAAGGQAE